VKNFNEMTPQEIEEMEEAAIQNAGNFGPARDMWHPDYGWILLDGELTGAGKRFYENQKKQFEQK
jgi:hypothetical protein